MMLSLRPAAFTAVLLLLPAATLLSQEKPEAPAEKPADAAATEKRTLKFFRPETKGAKYELKTKASFVRTTDLRIPGGVRRSIGDAENVEISLEGTMEVTAVTEKAKRLDGYTIKVAKMTLKDDSGEKDTVKPGGEITAARGISDTTFLVNGETADELMTAALTVALPGLLPVDAAVEDVFDPPAAVAFGEEWKPAKEKLAETVGRMLTATASEEKTSATVFYKKVATIDGQPVDVAGISLRASFSSLPNLPPGTTLKDATVEVESSTGLSRDTAISAPATERETTDFTVVFEGGTGDSAAEVTVKSHHEINRSFKPVK